MRSALTQKNRSANREARTVRVKESVFSSNDANAPGAFHHEGGDRNDAYPKEFWVTYRSLHRADAWKVNDERLQRETEIVGAAPA
jgi:hypothetical protein